MSTRPRLLITAVGAVMVLGVLVAAVPTASAQSLNGSIYQADGASPPLYVFFSVSGSTFIAGLLTYNSNGNGRWAGAIGSTDGVSGTGQVLAPSGFTLTVPPNTTFHFQLDAPGAAHGSYSSTGLTGFISPESGRFTRISP
jgi:hypothetical protein